MKPPKNTPRHRLVIFRTLSMNNHKNHERYKQLNKRLTIKI